MKISVSSDEHAPLVDALLAEITARGHESVYFGPAAGEKESDWPDVTQQAVEALTSGSVDQAIVLCWTGTGCSIVANKHRGIRAALCRDAETAEGARKWNDANVLALSLASTPVDELSGILDAWFKTGPGEDDWNRAQLRKLEDLDG